MTTFKNGDVVLLKNVPDGYYKDLYRLISDHQINQYLTNFRNGDSLQKFPYLYDYGFFVHRYEWEDSKYLGGFSLYLPYITDKQFECSGCGRTAKIKRFTFLKEDNAPFWNFDNKPASPGGGVIHWHLVNFWELDYKWLD